MKLPFSLPTDTFYGALTFLGLAAVIYSFMVPTSQFDEYKKLQRDAEEEQAVLSIEQRYFEKTEKHLNEAGLNDAQTIERLLTQEKDLAIRAAKLETTWLRVGDMKKNWEKSRLWARLVGTGGIVTTITGFALWRRRELANTKKTD